MSPAATVLPEPRAARSLAVAFFAVAAVVNLWFATRSWRDNLLDAHDFRQVQTAITAYYFRQDGVKLDYETPIFGAPWSIPLEFPTYQACTAWLSRGTGLPLEQAGRLTSLFFFYAGLPALFLLLRRWQLSFAAALCAVAAVLTSPLYTFYSRTFMIESTALCFSLWFLLGFWDCLHGSRGRGLALAWSCGTLGILTKVTTFAVFCVPALVMGLGAVRTAWAGTRAAAWRRLGWCGLIAAPVLVAGGWWVRHSDHLKELNPYAGFITSAGLRQWNLGTLPQRLSGEFWSTIYTNVSRNILSEPALLLLLAGWPLLARAGRFRVLLLLAGFSGGFLIFSNLYFIHDYYYYGSAVFLLAAFGVVAGTVLDESRLPWLMRAGLVGGTLLLAQYAAFSRTYENFYRRPNPPPLPLTEVIRATTARDDVLAVFGLDWNAQLAYYSGRRCIMVPHNRVDDTAAFAQVLANLGDRHVVGMVVAGGLKNAPFFIRPRLAQLGLEPNPIAETDDEALYLLPDLADAARARLKGRVFPGVRLELTPLPPPPEMKEEHSLDTAEWHRQLAPFMSPAPYYYRGIFPVTLGEPSEPVMLHTHAPTELYFHPPAGARHIRARGGLVPAAYTDGHTTDGIVIQIFEERAPGRRRKIFERALRPLDNPADRKEAAVIVDRPEPFQGTLVFRMDPGPAGSVNFDWAYWSRIEIR